MVMFLLVIAYLIRYPEKFPIVMAYLIRHPEPNLIKGAKRYNLAEAPLLPFMSLLAQQQH